MLLAVDFGTKLLHFSPPCKQKGAVSALLSLAGEHGEGQKTAENNAKDYLVMVREKNGRTYEEPLPEFRAPVDWDALRERKGSQAR